MDVKKRRKLVKGLYIAEMMIFLAAAVANIIVLSGIVQIKITQFMLLIFVCIIIAISTVIKMHEDTKKTRKFYLMLMPITIAWFVTFILILFLKMY